MSDLSDLRDIAPGPPPKETGPLERPEARGGKKKARKPLPRRSARRADVEALQFGEQAERCRRAPCASCGKSPKFGEQTDPHHWPTRANGGLDRDTMPLCPGPEGCHEKFHALGSPRAFKAKTGCDVLAEIDRMRKGAP